MNRVGDVDTAQEKFEKCAGKLFRPGERIVAAVSGGPDSVALLHLLVEFIRRAFEASPQRLLAVAHLNHGLRGAEAEEDAAFVEGTAEGMGLRCFSGKVDVRELTRVRRLSIETAAREVRYRFLAQAAREFGATTVAVGHTLDDQVETVLMRILRGAGLRGLRGMPTVRTLEGNAVLVRPLLAVTRAEILAYVASHGLAYRTDSSNLEPRCLRNRVRLELLPLLERIAPGVRDRLAALAREARDIHESLEGRIAALLEEAGARGGTGETLDLARLRELPTWAAGEVLRRYTRDRLGVELYRVHVDAALDMISRGAGTLHVPGGATIEVSGGILRLCRPVGQAAAATPHQSEWSLTVPGEVAIEEFALVLKAEDWRPGLPMRGADDCQDRNAVQECYRGAVPVPPDRWVEFVDADKLSAPLTIRTWRPGDRFVPLGCSGSKKLQDFFTDLKLPRWKRNGVPVILDSRGQIVWVVGFRLDDRVKVTPTTKRFVRLNAQWQESPSY